MRLTIFTRYGTLGASSRYRYYMYAERLKEAGFDLKISNFLSNRYLEKLYDKKRVAFWQVIKAYVKRFFTSVAAPENLILEYELFPYMPYWFDRLFLKKRKYILNFDDNVWIKYKNKPYLQGKYDLLVRNASGVIVANDFLMEKVRDLNNNVVKIPTVVDLDNYACEKPKFKKFTVIWIGTPVTYRYLLSYADVLQNLASACDFELLVLAKKELAKERIPGVNMKFVDWSQEKEAELLSRSHIGIMPLTDDEFSKGKSAFKLIQYLAAGLPVIASPVGENNKVVEHGTNGYLADTPENWLECFNKLYKDNDFYSKMADNAVKSSVEYSIQKYSVVMTDFIKNAFQ
jgi:glycosyltransferase involved in cell wall biosynthesis